MNYAFRLWVLGFGFFGASFIGRHCDAQSSESTARLSVRPHKMATGTRNIQAGERLLASLDSAIVYVPASCVGARRVPLVVVMHGGGSSSREVIDQQRQFADKHGMILLAPNAPGEHWNPSGAVKVDSAMKLVLREYAIDPDKIALTGMSEGGRMALYLGRNNLDVFSRIAPMSPAVDTLPTTGGPQNTTTQFLLMTGIGEQGGFWDAPFDVARQERQAGRLAELVVTLRPHERRSADEALAWSWIQNSWATPQRALMTAPVADSTLVLTTDMVDKFLDFWSRFMDQPLSIRDAGHKRRVFFNIPEAQARQFGMPPRLMQSFVPWPDSVSATGRRANQTQVTIVLGQERVLVPMMNIVALAAQNEAVAKNLQEIGLTAAQAEAYRVALLTALATSKMNERQLGNIEVGSVLAKNMAFVKAHKQEIAVLSDAGVWDIP